MAKSLPFSVEYIIRSSPTILYNFITSPDGLCQWFTDEVDINDNEYVFKWEGSAEKATVIDFEEDVFIRFQWEDGEPHEYFEFRISKSPVTSDTIFTVTDFAEPGEEDDQRRLWNTQVADLIKQIGGA